MTNFTLDTIQPANAEYKPIKALVYGVPGVGKTVFGSTFERPILLRTEDGARAIADLPTFPELATTFDDVMNALRSLYSEHNYKTIVIDSVDWLEPIVFAYTCNWLAVQSIESVGYGKGYVEADKNWLTILTALERLRMDKGMNIVLLAHSDVKTVEMPGADAYQRYLIKLHKRGSALIQEWCDMILFAGYKANFTKEENGFNKTRTIANGNGERVLFTSERPSHLGKNRVGLPDQIYIGHDKEWKSFHSEYNKATDGRYWPELEG